MGVEDIKLYESVKTAKIDWQKVLERYKWPLGLGLIGLVLLITGFYYYLAATKEETKIEIIPAEEKEVTSIWVDIEGAIEKPGVYELPAESRLSDLLIRAGGLSAKADRVWLKKNINLAQKLADGIKIYLPWQGEVSQTSETGVNSAPQVAGMINQKTNINNASLSELDSLWGIGPIRAQAIISNRPYQTIEELKSKKILPSNIFEKVKDSICI